MRKTEPEPDNLRNQEFLERNPLDSLTNDICRERTWLHHQSSSKLLSGLADKAEMFERCTPNIKGSLHDEQCAAPSSVEETKSHTVFSEGTSCSTPDPINCLDQDCFFTPQAVIPSSSKKMEGRPFCYRRLKYYNAANQHTTVCDESLPFDLDALVVNAEAECGNIQMITAEVCSNIENMAHANDSLRSLHVNVPVFKGTRTSLPMEFDYDHNEVAEFKEHERASFPILPRLHNNQNTVTGRVSHDSSLTTSALLSSQLQTELNFSQSSRVLQKNIPETTSQRLLNNDACRSHAAGDHVYGRDQRQDNSLDKIKAKRCLSSLITLVDALKKAENYILRLVFSMDTSISVKKISSIKSNINDDLDELVLRARKMFFEGSSYKIVGESLSFECRQLRNRIRHTEMLYEVLHSKVLLMPTTIAKLRLRNVECKIAHDNSQSPHRESINSEPVGVYKVDGNDDLVDWSVRKSTRTELDKHCSLVEDLTLSQNQSPKADISSITRRSEPAGSADQLLENEDLQPVIDRLDLSQVSIESHSERGCSGGISTSVKKNKVVKISFDGSTSVPSTQCMESSYNIRWPSLEKLDESIRTALEDSYSLETTKTEISQDVQEAVNSLILDSFDGHSSLNESIGPMCTLGNEEAKHDAKSVVQQQSNALEDSCEDLLSISTAIDIEPEISSSPRVNVLDSLNSQEEIASLKEREEKLFQEYRETVLRGGVERLIRYFCETLYGKRENGFEKHSIFGDYYMLIGLVRTKSLAIEEFQAPFISSLTSNDYGLRVEAFRADVLSKVFDVAHMLWPTNWNSDNRCELERVSNINKIRPEHISVDDFFRSCTDYLKLHEATFSKIFAKQFGTYGIGPDRKAALFAINNEHRQWLTKDLKVNYENATKATEDKFMVKRNDEALSLNDTEESMLYEN